MAKRIKVAVTGAAGQIGYALLFRIAAGEMFGSSPEADVVTKSTGTGWLGLSA